MSKASTIASYLQSVLQDSADLSAVEDTNIWLGVKETITSFPCLVIESMGGELVSETYPYERRIKRFAVIGYIQEFNKDTSLTDLLDLENNVFKALSQDVTLDGNALDVNIRGEAEEFSQYPIRGFSIDVDVLYQQDRTERT